MRSGLNGRRVNRLAVNATYREKVFGEAKALLDLESVLEGVTKAGILPGPVTMLLDVVTYASGTASPGSEGVAWIELPMLASAEVSPGSEGVALVEVPVIASAEVSPGSEGISLVEIETSAQGSVYLVANGAGTALVEPLLVGNPSVSGVEPSRGLAIITMPSRVSVLAIPYIPEEYAVTPPARLVDAGIRASLMVADGRRFLRVENLREAPLEVEGGGRDIEIADSRREIEVRHKRRLEP